MSVVVEPTVDWSPDKMIEVSLSEPDDFLKVRETLTRIGVASRKENSDSYWSRITKGKETVSILPHSSQAG